MRKPSAAVAALAAAAGLALCGVASAATIGVNEDETKTDTSLYAGMADVGLKQNILSLTWAQGQGIPSGQQTVIRSAAAAAAAKGIKIVLAIYPAAGNASRLGDPGNTSEFVAYVVNAMKSFPQIRSVIVGNEPNRTLFMSPVNGGTYAQILAAAYDALKAADSGIQVIGVGLSPRGSGDGSSQFPPQFVKQMGDWVRSSGRKAPIMDAFSFHPYPFPVTKAPSDTSDWPTVGMADLYRLKQAIWDAFNGTGQPTVEDGLKLDLDEVAYQVPTDGKAGYTGSENVDTVSEDTQATFYAMLVNMVACDPSVETLNFFHFTDETNRAGFQSGFLDAARAQRAVYGRVKSAIGSTGGGGSCAGTPVSWRHETGVMGFKADLTGVRPAYPRTLSSLTQKVRVEEDASVTVNLLDASGKAVATVTRKVPAQAMARPDAAATVQLPLRGLRDGTYTLQVAATAAMNDQRTSTATSQPIAIGNASARTTGAATTTGPRPRGKKPPLQGCGTLPNVKTVTCVGGKPAVGACKQGYADGNRVASDGCEINLLGDPRNCGRVGNAVPSGYACQNGLSTKRKKGKGKG